jgi:hypothetical protein
LVPKRLSVLGRGRLYGPQHRKRDFLGPTYMVGVTNETRWSRSRQEKEMLRKAALRCEKHAEGMSGEILIRKIVCLKRRVQEAQKIPNERDVGTFHEERKMIWKTKVHLPQNIELRFRLCRRREICFELFKDFLS